MTGAPDWKAKRGREKRDVAKLSRSGTLDKFNSPHASAKRPPTQAELFPADFNPRAPAEKKGS